MSYGVNKNIIIVLILILIVGAGVLYRTIVLKGEICTIDQGEDKVVNMISKEAAWEFDPSHIELNKCDKVTLNIYNEDEYDHGLAIDVFGVNRRLDPKVTTTIKFTAAKEGALVFYCSVPCGDGHFTHVGDIEIFDVEFE